MGRRAELGLLAKRLDRVSASGVGTAVAIRGRRQVGKSRLVQEFCDQAGVPYLFFTATKGASPVEAVADFLSALKDSSLPRDRELVSLSTSGSWPDAFRVLATALPERPVVVVLDELPGSQSRTTCSTGPCRRPGTDSWPGVRCCCSYLAATCT